MKALKWIKQLAIPGMIAFSLTACTNPPVTTTQQGNLDNLSLPGQNSSSTPSSKPIILPSSSPSSEATVVKSPRLSNVIAWEVRPTGQSEPVSMLVGTVHAPFADGYQLPADFMARLNASKALYLETDVELLDQLTGQIVTQVLNREQNLETMLGTASWTKLLARLAELKLPANPDALRLFRPWYINLMLGSIPNAEPIKLESVMDMSLKQRAETAKIPLRYLESPAEQLSALQAIPADEYVRLIKENLDAGVDKLISERNKIFEIYNTGDLAALEAAEVESRQESEAFFDNMLRKRNQSWLNLLKTQLKTESLTVATGALHMAGSEGLVKQLQAMGFEVKQIEFKP